MSVQTSVFTNPILYKLLSVQTRLWANQWGKIMKIITNKPTRNIKQIVLFIQSHTLHYLEPIERAVFDKTAVNQKWVGHLTIIWNTDLGKYLCG